MSANTPLWKGSTSLIEQGDSGALNLQERIYYVQKLKGPYATATAFANLHYRGTTWTLTIDGIGSANFIVEDCKVDRERGGQGIVTVNYCYLGTPPPEEWALSPFELNPAVERHSFFAALTPHDLKQAKMYFNVATSSGAGSISATIEMGANADLITNLVNKWLRGEENYYLAAVKFQHTLYAFTAFSETLGGIRQSPSGTFSSYIPAGLSWLRQADEQSWNNGIWKLTRTWIGAPDSWWDSDLYP